MTVTYTANLHTAQKCGTAVKILCRWRGSIYQLICYNLLFFMSTFVGLSIMYTFILPMDPKLKYLFESFCISCASVSNSIPLTFLLGFFLTQVLLRWWQQFTALPWPDNLAMKLVTHMGDKGPEVKSSIASIVRLSNLSIILALRQTSLRAAKRFETMGKLVECGLLLPEELSQLESASDDDSNTPSSKPLTSSSARAFTTSTGYVMPLGWALAIVRSLHEKNKLPDYVAYQDLVNEIMKIGDNLRLTGFYAWVNFPLAYTQVIAFSTYFYVFLLLFSEQRLQPSPSDWLSLDWTPSCRNASFLPSIVVVLKFCCYVGLLKVAETALNPFGEDDDDFDIGFIVDRNLQLSMQIANDPSYHTTHLPSEASTHNPEPHLLPHTKGSQALAEREGLPPDVAGTLVHQKSRRRRLLLGGGREEGSSLSSLWSIGTSVKRKGSHCQMTERRPPIWRRTSSSSESNASSSNHQQTQLKPSLSPKVKKSNSLATADLGRKAFAKMVSASEEKKDSYLLQIENEEGRK